MPQTPQTSQTSIVVGVDGSPSSLRAVAWAADMAAAMGVPLEVVAAYGAPLTLELYADFSPQFSGHLHDATRALLDEGVAAAHAAAPGIEVLERLADRPPAAALLEAAGDRLLVVGRHGSNPRRLGNLGSVTDQVITHADGPVVVVPSEPAAGDRIVVGSDASPHSVAALSFAFATAQLTHHPVTVLHSWGIDDIWIGSPVPVEPIDLKAMYDHSERRLREIGDPVVARHPGVDVEWVLERETPARALVDRASTASLLVVGRRGHGGFPALLLGSTSRSLTHAAPCPVAVVPST